MSDHYCGISKTNGHRCALRRAGNSPSDIIKTTGSAKMTVYRVVVKFVATEEVERSHHRPQEDHKKTKIVLADLKKSMKADPSQSLMKLAENAMLAFEPSVEQTLKSLR